jgi:uridine kinase
VCLSRVLAWLGHDFVCAATGLAEYNFDNPDAFDGLAMSVCLDDLAVSPFAPTAELAQAPELFKETLVEFCLCVCLDQKKKAVDVPVYDFKLHQRSKETRRVEPADVVIVEGIMVLHMEEVRDRLNMKIFVDTDDDVRLARRYSNPTTGALVCAHVRARAAAGRRFL